MEKWKSVVGFENRYEVSDKGNVRNARTRVVLRPQKRNHGYLCAWLYDGHHGKQFSIHRLVAEAFIDNPNGYTEVNHIDECKQNNSADNLEWCDRKYNTNYGTAQKRRSGKNVNGPKAKAIDQLDLNGNYISTFPSMAEIKRTLGFNQSNIFCAIHGKYSQAYGFKWRYSIEAYRQGRRKTATDRQVLKTEITVGDDLKARKETEYGTNRRKQNRRVRHDVDGRETERVARS